MFYYVHSCIILQFFPQRGWHFKSHHLNPMLMFSAFQGVSLRPLFLSLYLEQLWANQFPNS